MFVKLFSFLFILFAFWKLSDADLSLSPKVVIERKVLPMDVPFETIEAESYLNHIRTEMGMQRLSHNPHLQSAAKAHATYLVSNNAHGHEEREGAKDFVAQSVVERAFFFDYDSGMVSENLSTQNHNARSSVDGLFSAIYHRFGFLSPDISEVGVGITQDKSDSDKSAFVYLMGNSDLNALCSGKSFSGSSKYWKGCRETSQRIKDKDFTEAVNSSKRNNPAIILYPYDGQKEVPPAFYAEIPDPLPDHEVSGFPVSVEFNDYFFKEIDLISFNINNETGDRVEVLLMDSDTDPHQRFTANQFTIFPLKRLEYNHTYRAELLYETKGTNKTITWHFSTKQILEKLFIIGENSEMLTIEAKRSYVIYFQPLHAHDLIKDMLFPVDVDVQFLDNNTIKLTVMSEDLDEFEIKSATRKLKIFVK
jgi:hypothetical protein